LNIQELLGSSTAPTWVDLALGLALLASIVLGLVRGLVFEVMSLAGWVVAFVVAQLFGDEVARFIPIGTPGDALNHGVAIALTFFATLVVWGLLSRLVRLLVRVTPLSAVDRVMGAGFGVLRGGVLLLIVATVMLMTPAGRTRAWQHSWLGPASVALVQAVKPFLPHDVVKHMPNLPEVLRKLPPPALKT
jgi:membrane protein required for colicin V production